MSTFSDTASLLHVPNFSSQYEDPTNSAPQGIDQGGWTVIHLSDRENHTGVKFVLGNNDLVEVKVVKQPDNSFVLAAVFKGSASSSAIMNLQDQVTPGVPGQGDERAQQEMRRSDSNLMTEEEWVKKMRGWLMVLATIVLSVTYQAGLNPPGGVWQEDSAGHDAGEPINQTKNPKSYTVFKVSNTMAMAQSLLILLLLIKRTVFQDSGHYVHALRILVITSLLALATAYSVSFPGEYVPLVFYLVLINVFLTAVLRKAVEKWSDDDSLGATKEKVTKFVRAVKAWLLIIIFYSSAPIVIVYQKKKWPPQPWLNIILSFICAAGTILWVY